MADNQAEKPQVAEKKEEKPKQPTALEGAVNESWHAIKASTNALVGTGAIAGATALFGLDGLAVSASFPYGGRIVSKLKGKEFITGQFRDESITGALFTPLSWYGINAVKQVPKAFGLDAIVTNVMGQSLPLASSLVAGGLTLGVLAPALISIYYPLEYVVKNKTFKGVGKYFKENFYPGFKRLMPLNIFTGAAVGATYAMPFLAPYLFPVLAASNILFRISLSKGEGKIEYKRLLYPSTYLPNLLNPFYLATGLCLAAMRLTGCKKNRDL